MRVKEKKDAVFVRGVVIACGETDTTGDAPVDRESVKKIFSNYLTMETDVQHSWVKNFGVYVLENTITVNPCEIAGQDVPVGSWIASMMVTNPDIKAMITDGRIRGYSVGAVGEKGLNENKHFLNKSLRYEDLCDAEELNPLFISLVENPANGYFLEVLDYDGFLAKSKDYNFDENNVMSEEVIIDDMGKESNSVIKTLTDAFVKLALSGNSDSEDEKKEEEDVVVEEDLEKACKDEELEKSDEPVSDISNMELLEKLPVAVAEAVVEALKVLAEESAPSNDDDGDEVLEKDDGDGEDGEEDGDGQTIDGEAEEEESSDNPQKKDKLTKSIDNTDDDVRLTKSTDKNMIPEKHAVKRNTFLNSGKRDMFGRNKRFL